MPVPVGRAPPSLPERVDDPQQPAGERRRAGSAVATAAPVELGVQLDEEPMGTLHPRVAGAVDEGVGGGRAAPALHRQAPRQRGGDRGRALEQAGGGGHVLAPDRVGETSEQLVQVLAEGALVTAHGLQLHLAVGQLAPVSLGADQALEAPAVAGLLGGGSLGVSAPQLTGDDGRAG